MNLSHPSKLCSLEKLIHGLSIPATKNLSYYDQLIQSLDIPIDSIDPYCTWNERSYTRNLVHSTDLYELLILCWQKGQTSPIHDHQEQDCWIYVVEGTIEETLYQPTLHDDQRFSLGETDRIIYHKGDKSRLMNSMLAWHSIKPLSQQAITLHLYSLPIKKCHLYNLQTGQLSERKLNCS